MRKKSLLKRFNREDISTLPVNNVDNVTQLLTIRRDSGKSRIKKHAENFNSWQKVDFTHLTIEGYLESRVKDNRTKYKNHDRIE